MLDMRRRLIAPIFLLLLAAAPALGQQEIVIAQGVDISTFDVHKHSTTSNEAILANIVDYLVMMDTNGDRQPALATSWEPVSDTAWQFLLREGVLWHDGEPFTAKDVKFTLERAANDTSLDQYESFRQIREVEIVNDHEIMIHTYEPDPVLINRVSRLGAGIVPQHYIEEVGWDEFAVSPMGTGPYRFVEWHRDDRVVMEAFDDHWRGRPAYDRVVHRAISEESTRVNELLTGGVHIATNVPVQEEDRIAAGGSAQTMPWPSSRVMLFVVNTADDKVTGDPLVREAIEYAIDNQLLIDALMGGYGTPTRARLTPGVTGVPMELYGTYEYDPERAVALLAEAGYGPGELTVKIEGPTGRYPKDSEIAELVAVMLEQVGINAPMEVLEWSAFQSRIWNVDNVENIVLIGLANSMFDGWFALRAFLCDGSYKDRTNWCHEEFDRLVRAAEVEVDAELRSQYLHEAFYIMLEERPLIALYQVESLVGISNDVDWTPRQDELLWMFDAQPLGSAN